MQELVDIAVAGKAEVRLLPLERWGLMLTGPIFALDTQRKYFTKQLSHLASEVSLPLFIHSRSIGEEMARLLGEHGVPNGVVHSFDGTGGYAALLDIGMHIGINGVSKDAREFGGGCSHSTRQTADRADGPWCGIKGLMQVLTLSPRPFQPKRRRSGNLASL